MKSALKRKLESETYLKNLGIPFIDHLPMIEEEKETEIRTAESIAKRILVLTYLCYVGEEEDGKEEVIEFFKEHNLWVDVSPIEKELLMSKVAFSQQEKIDISWRSECTWLLLWVIDKFENLELPSEETLIPEILEYLPDFLSDPSEFIRTAQLRNKSEILDISDLTYRLHWATRSARLNNEELPQLNSSVVKERHHAINWVTHYDGLDWDDMTTDT